MKIGEYIFLKIILMRCLQRFFIFLPSIYKIIKMEAKKK
jgi:hypothetical protein